MADEPEPKDLQLKLRFGEKLRARLAASATEHGASLNSEIVRRLEASFKYEELFSDRQTTSLLLDAVEEIRRWEAIADGKWYSDWHAYGAVSEAVNHLLSMRHPTNLPVAEVLRLGNKIRELIDEHKQAVRIVEAGDVSDENAGAMGLDAQSFRFLAEAMRHRLPYLDKEIDEAKRAWIAATKTDADHEAETGGRSLFHELHPTSGRNLLRGLASSTAGDRNGA